MNQNRIDHLLEAAVARALGVKLPRARRNVPARKTRTIKRAA